MKILDLLSSEEACSRFFRDVRAVKRLMLSLREETQPVKMDTETALKIIKPQILKIVFIFMAFLAILIRS